MYQELEQLKQRLPLLDYLRRSHWMARRAGAPAEFVGVCPLHRETRPSFYVNARKNLFYCHGCGRGGDLIRLIELSHGLSFRQISRISSNTSSHQFRQPTVAPCWNKRRPSTNSNSTGIRKRSTISNSADCTTPPSSKNWASAMLPAETCGAIWPPKAIRSIGCATRASSIGRAAIPSAGV